MREDRAADSSAADDVVVKILMADLLRWMEWWRMDVHCSDLKLTSNSNPLKDD